MVLWAATHQKVSLACRVRPVSPEAKCHWFHAPNVHVQQNNSTKMTKYNVQMNYSSGICTLQLKPDHTDLGQWTCRFTLNNENGILELGSTAVVLLNNVTDEKLGWIVGALTTMVLFLMIIVVVLVVCKAKLFTRRVQVSETMSSTERKQNNQLCSDRYTEGPTKINFRFSDQNSLDSLPDVNSVIPNRSPHLYERVEKCTVPVSKMLYENVKG